MIWKIHVIPLNVLRQYEKMRHLDLFSGLGGFSLAAQRVWKDEHKIVAFCEIDKFCQKVLRKHWPDVPIIEDIHDLKGDELEAVELITGGYPCQPFSFAGKQRGTEDVRYLWPEMFRVIKQAKPNWIIIENVAGIVNLGLDTVLADLESKGYSTQTFIIPACAKNAPHRRNRIWIIANAEKRNDGKHNREPKKRQKPVSGICPCKSDVTDTNNERFQRKFIANGSEGTEIRDERIAGRNRTWRENWAEVAAELCGVDDGFPAKLDGFKLSKSKHRIERLKSLGNAVVPQIVYEIFKVIKIMENQHDTGIKSH